MDAENAGVIAEALGGTSWNSGGDIHLVRLERADGHLVVISDEVVSEYQDENAFEENRPVRSILLH